ncbi:hypothetical protein [Lacrimispora indolis]|uniref:hypothetical protein n=1 Tax=Lacrimispora indolis TaxID=69825 RepID=UPI000462C1EF|nr:hypothetical protein [[Clostridium] methoxybenzovorans]
MNWQEVYNKLSDDLVNAFNFFMGNMKLTKVFKATVTQKVNNTVYKVSYKNAEYRVKSDYNLSIGEMVWVCAPQNNWDSLFVVSHKSNSLKNYEFREDGIYLDGVKITK